MHHHIQGIKALFHERVLSAVNSDESKANITPSVPLGTMYVMLAVARQCGANCSGDKRPRAFVAPHILKLYYVKTCPL